jgi:hypothetical protein
VSPSGIVAACTRGVPGVHGGGEPLVTYPEWSDIRNSNFARTRFFHESITETNYEVIRLAFEIGKRGLSGLFICIPRGRRSSAGPSCT